MEDLFLLGITLIILGYIIWYIYKNIKTNGKPDSQITKIHHEHDSGYDIEYFDWQPKKNPNYAGNLFQLTWWWEPKHRIIKDAHKIVRNKK